MNSQTNPGGLPRLLAGIPAHRAMGLREHLATHGAMPSFASAKRRGRAQGANALIDVVEQSGLRGRGGAAFPTAAKLRAVVGARGRPIVIANAAEGEPTSLKDRVLLESLPHLVLDGGVLAATAVGADELILCVDEFADTALQSTAHALREHQADDRNALKLTLQAIPQGYVSGQESALVNLLNGGPAKPTLTPPLPFERGVRGRPTLINNIETLAHIALIARHGSAWFRELGTPSQPGSTLLTLSGAVTHPGVYEIEHGAPLRELIEAAGGTSSGIRAVLVGGYAGTWLDARHSSTLKLSNEQLASHGASLGAGIVVLLSEATCAVAETSRVARWMASQSSGQCGPCVHGLNAIASAIEELAAGVASASALEQVARWASLARGRGACRHPDGAVRFIASALEVFAEEFADHARHGRCDACVQPRELPLPRFAALAKAA